MNNPTINVSTEKELRISTKKNLLNADLHTTLSLLGNIVHKRRSENPNSEEPVIDKDSIKEKRRKNQEKIAIQDPFKRTVRKKVK